MLVLGGVIWAKTCLLEAYHNSIQAFTNQGKGKEAALLSLSGIDMIVDYQAIQKLNHFT